MYLYFAIPKTFQSNLQSKIYPTICTTISNVAPEEGCYCNQLLWMKLAIPPCSDLMKVLQKIILDISTQVNVLLLSNIDLKHTLGLSIKVPKLRMKERIKEREKEQEENSERKIIINQHKPKTSKKTHPPLTPICSFLGRPPFKIYSTFLYIFWNHLPLRSHLNFPYISWPLTKIAYISTSHLVLSILCFFFLYSWIVFG